MKIMSSGISKLVLGVICLTLVILKGQGQQCGSAVGGKECDGKLCCSSAGYCGTTEPYCGAGCQSNCHQSPPPSPPAPPSPIQEFFTEKLFDQFLMHRGTSPCTGSFYTYYAFITAANDFPEFGNTGNLDTRKREIAAFFGQTSQETFGGWDGAPDGKYSWGYCWVEERGCEGHPSPCTGYCVPNAEWPCAQGKAYYGRGPIQLSYNYNYGPAGQGLKPKYDLLKNPDLVSQNAVIAFKTALWFWMTPQSPKPSAHDVITGKWTPTPADIACNRLPGYGVITNIINGGVECNKGPIPQVINRIEFYKKYCGIFGISPGDKLDCYTQCPFNSGLMLEGKSSSF